MKRVDELQSSQLFDNAAFMAAAHDLKVPLATIRSIVLDSDKTAAKLHEEYQKIGQLSDQALAMVSDMLSVYKLQASQQELPLTPVSANNELRFAVNQAKLFDKLNSRRLKVEYLPKRELSLILGDQYFLRRCFSNLLGNSLKYSDPRTKVVAKIFATDEYISCQIADNGPQIMDDDTAALEGELSTGSTKRSAGNSGLGLLLTGEMVRLMKGSVSVDSGNSGNFITIDLPRVRQQALF